jgi:hypothetical protein
MIQFCEDCGQKNSIDPAQIQENKAVFKCSVCNYQNSYRIKTETKTYPDKLLELSRITGVEKYILVDQTGKIAAHNIKNPKATGQIIVSCAKNSFAISESYIKYVILNKANQKKVFIFQAGNSYLGVIKQQHISNATLTENILNFLKGLI